MDIRCDEADQDAPRTGCRCEGCYRAREMSLDRRLIDLARSEPMPRRMQPSKTVLHRILTHYLMGQIEYDALHLTIIAALAKLADNQFEQLLETASRTLSSLIIRPFAPSRDKVPKDGD